MNWGPEAKGPRFLYPMTSMSNPMQRKGEGDHCSLRGLRLGIDGRSRTQRQTELASQKGEDSSIKLIQITKKAACITALILKLGKTKSKHLL